mmetsp:Transcript_62473/g.136598  ORF Transcript_62473/g.136598 Transcript_62473/m.136598 type:complete len:577 (-) Transcript_62473:29-1759(-)
MVTLLEPPPASPARSRSPSGGDGTHEKEEGFAPAGGGQGRSASGDRPPPPQLPAGHGRQTSDPPDPIVKRTNTGRKPKRPRREENVNNSDDDAAVDGNAGAEGMNEGTATASEPSMKRANTRLAVRPGMLDLSQQALANALRSQAAIERREARDFVRRETRRLGRFRRTLLNSDEGMQWDGGEEALFIEKLRARISDQRGFVDKSRKCLNGKKLPEGGTVNMSQDEMDDEFWEQRELCTSKLEAVKRDEAELKERESKLRNDREDLLRLSRSLEVEDNHSFGPMPSFQNSRYQPLRLLTKSQTTLGYRAFDLVTSKPCLLKIVTLEAHVSDKEERLKAAAAQCERLRDPRTKLPGVVSLLDYFTSNPGDQTPTFATVWELFEGEPIETYLRRHGALSEKEVKAIVLQLLSVIRGLESNGFSLKAQDLRTSRLLLRVGEVKVNGFALLTSLHDTRKKFRSLVRSSSSLHDPEANSVPRGDSQEADEDSSDDWVSFASRAVGWAMYEMIFNKSPEPVDSDPLQAPQVPIPDVPKISQECRELLAKLLNRDSRLGVPDLSNHPFLSPPGSRASAGGARR